MASTVPAKSQALHGFALPHLKWNKDNHSNGQHRRRRSIKSPSLESHPSSGYPLREPSRQSPLHDSASATLVQSQLSVLAESTMSPVRDDLMKYSPLRGESSKQSPLQNSAKQSPMLGDSVKQSLKHNIASESEASMNNKSILIEYHRNHLKNSVSETNRNGRYLSNLDRATEKSEKKLKATEADASATKEKRSRILLKIPRENESEENQQEEPHKIDSNLDEDGEDNDEAEEEGKMNHNDDEPKTWNLRPRKQICKSLNGVPGKINGSAMLDKKSQSPLRNSSNRLVENEANGVGGQKKEKRKLSVSIALSKEEIEEDVFILTGSKPTRRPKKRAKNIQKHLDYLFPGLWLTSITPDSYKVSETYLKG